MGVNEMKAIGSAIAATLKAPEDEAVKAQSRKTVEELCKKFPLYESKLAAVR